MPRGEGYRNVVRIEFPSGQLELAEAAAIAFDLPFEEFVRRAVIEAINYGKEHPTRDSYWGSLRRVTVAEGIV